MKFPGPLKELTPMGIRNDQRRFTIMLYKHRQSQPLSNLFHISIIGSLAGINNNNIITFPTITCCVYIMYKATFFSPLKET